MAGQGGLPRGKGAPGGMAGKALREAPGVQELFASQSTTLAETGFEQPTWLLSRGWCFCSAPGRGSQDTLGSSARTGITSTHPDGWRQTLACGRQEGELRVLGSESAGLLAQLSCRAGHTQGEGQRETGSLSAPRGGDAIWIPEGTVRPRPPQRRGLYPYNSLPGASGL